MLSHDSIKALNKRSCMSLSMCAPCIHLSICSTHISRRVCVSRSPCIVVLQPRCPFVTVWLHGHIIMLYYSTLRSELCKLGIMQGLAQTHQALKVRLLQSCGAHMAMCHGSQQLQKLGWPQLLEVFRQAVFMVSCIPCPLASSAADSASGHSQMCLCPPPMHLQMAFSGSTVTWYRQELSLVFGLCRQTLTFYCLLTLSASRKVLLTGASAL